MAYDVGDIAIPKLEVTPFDGTTTVTVLVKAPDGTTSTPAATSADSGHTWTCQVPLMQAGLWSVIWTVTGTGAGVQTDELEADPLPPATAELRQVRLLIADTSQANRIFSSQQLADFLALNNGSVRRAAAQALDVLAANEALVSKKIRSQDLSTDGPAVADALRKQAAELRRQEDNSEGDPEASGFEIAEFNPYQCSPEFTEWPL